MKWPDVTLNLGKCLKTMVDTRISLSFRIVVTALVCLHTFCNPFPTSFSIGNSLTAVATYQKCLNLQGKSDSKLISYCTSIDIVDAEKQIKQINKAKEKPQRFIHPQVFKMFHRAQFLVRQGDNVVAQRLLLRCLELNPFDSHSWLALARLEAKLGNVVRAREVFEQSTLRCPNNVHILHAWGHMEQKHGNEALARDCWSQAMIIDPLNAYVCHALSNLEKRIRNFDSAREVLEIVVKERPTSALCVSLAELERQLGDSGRAREVLLHGLKKCDKERSKLLLALAWLEEDAYDNAQEARRLIEEALRIDKNNVRVHIAKASMELRSGRINDARATLRSATNLQSDDGVHYTMWATLEIDSGNFREARRLLEEGFRKFPGDQFLLQRWGALESKFGSIKKARELFDRSIIIQPHAPTFVAWAILEEDQGNLALNPKKQLIVKAANKEQHTDEIEHTQEQGFISFGGDDISAKSDYVKSKGPTSFSSDRAEAASEAEWASLDPPVKDEERTTFYAHSNMLEKDLPLDFSVNDHTHKVKSGNKVNIDGSFTPLGDIPEAPAAPTAAAEAFAAAQFQKARDLYSVGMMVDPQHGPLYHAYGNMELRRGNITGARDVLMRGITMNCSDITSLYHAWGLLEIKDHRRAEAGDIFRRGVELGLKGNREVENGVGFLLHSLGMLEMDSHRVEEAKRVFSTGVSLFPQHSQMLLGLALASAKLGQQDAARQHFRAAVDADPTHAHSWQSWAIAEKTSGNMELARILFKQGLKKCPMHAALWQAFGVMELQTGNFEVARTLFAQSLQRNPDHAQSYQAWACLEVRLANLPKAKALVLQGIRRAPTHPALWTVAGLVEDRMGEVSRAKKILESALLRFPTHGALYKVFGELEAKEGNFIRARELFSVGLQKDPHCAAVYHAAALLEAKLGNLNGLSELHIKAKKHFKSSQYEVITAGHDDIIERISQLEIVAHENARDGKLSHLDDKVYDSDKFILDLVQ